MGSFLKYKILFVAFLLIFSVFSYVFVDSNLFYLKNFYSGFAFSNRLPTAFFYISSIIIFFIFYGIFIYLAAKKKINLREVFMLTGLTAVVLSFSYPAILSYDIFNYIATSKVLFFYHENPYVVMPIAFIGDPLLAFTHAANKIALYGPFWILLTGIPYLLGFGNFLVFLFSLKFFISIFYLGTAFLIWKISKSIIPVILFSLNPLVVIETLVSGHNDIVMIFLVLLSFFFLTKKKIFLALLFLTLSILIKYTTILLAPVFLYIVWRIAKKKEIHFEKIFYYSALLMYVGFFLSPIREEIYPWYAIWFLSFSCLIPNRKILVYISAAFSFGLLFRYVPFMLLGTYFGPTPLIKQLATFIPVISIFIFIAIKEKLWLKMLFR